MSTVIQHQTAIWAELKDWHDKEKTHNEQARACWPEIARRMARLRRDYPSDPMFGAALEEHGIEYSRNDRAAFIWMGGLKPDALEDAMDRCPRRSPRTFRQAVESWGDDYFKSLSQACEREDSSTSSEPTETPVPQETPESVQEKIQESEVGHRAEDLPVITRQSKLTRKLSASAASALVSHYTSPATRNMLGNLPKEVLAQLAALINAGRLGSKNDRHMERFSASVLVPDLPKEWMRSRIFDSDNPKQISKIKSIIEDIDRFVAMRDAGCKTKESCDRWWAENVKRKAVDVTMIAPQQATASGDRSPIVVHGVVIWPPVASLVDHPEKYKRSTAVAMFHLWLEMNRALSIAEKGHAARARIIQNLAKWIGLGGDPLMAGMLQQMTAAQMQDKDGNRETSSLSYINGDVV